MRPIQRPITLLAALALSAAPALADLIAEDFEPYAAGTFPGGPWHDIAGRADANPAPSPTMFVINTVDAHGELTHALQTTAVNGTNGVFADIEQARAHTVTMDVRIDRLASPGEGWPAGVGFLQDAGLGDVNRNPHAVIYGWTDRSWHLFVSQGVDSQAVDLRINGSGFQIGIWYTLSLMVDTETGTFEASVLDAATGALIGSRAHTFDGWDADRGHYDAISMFDGELPGSSTAGRSSIDNVRYVPVPSMSCLLLSAMAMRAIRRR